MICNCCDLEFNHENGGGVACSGLGPVSWCYCAECAVRYTEPECMFQYVFDDCGDNVAEHVRQCTTYKDGEYWTWQRYVEFRTSTV